MVLVFPNPAGAMNKISAAESSSARSMMSLREMDVRDDLKVLMELQWLPMPGLQQGVHTTHARRDGVARVLEHLDEFGGIRVIEAEGWK